MQSADLHAASSSAGVINQSNETNYTYAATSDNHAAAKNNNFHIDDSSMTIEFLAIFLSLMIIYIGFCLHYRKVMRIRPSAIREEIRAVMDESASRAAAASNRAEEQRKLEERKKWIDEVLLTRLIVEEKDEEMGSGAELEKKGVKIEVSANARCGELFGDEENQIDNIITNQGDHYVEERMAMENKGEVAEMKTLCKDSAAADTALSKKEEPPSEETATIALASSEVSIPSNKPPTTIIDTAPSSPSSPSSFRKCADALSCNNRHHSAPNICSNNSIFGGDNSKQATITLSAIQSTYGEECNICLSVFQVGDRAAWSKQHQHLRYGCSHVFHDVCLSRWLLIRDCCPICRRSYLNVDDEKKIHHREGVEDTVEGRESARYAGGGGGGGGGAIITAEED
jgi:hypothetical protein